ncbi:MAG: sigma-54-dependent transcriptional regulator, partial [Limisphaerales bacterium]
VLQEEGYQVAAEVRGDVGLARASHEAFNVIVTDLKLPGLNGLELVRQLHSSQPRLPLILITAFGTTETAIEATKYGAYDYVLKPFDVAELLDLVRKAADSNRLMSEPVVLGETGAARDALVGRSAAMQAIYKEIGRIASKPVNVLIRGETGTGKELIARAIYQHSDRAKAPFVAINCAAIPETLLESELFGHERGAFTGASERRVGRFEQANGGTIFLDEIGDMSFGTQVKLMRVLQEKSLERLGGKETIKVDVRVLAATHRDLELAIQQKQFREDLFYRLNVVRIHMPPLRERREDIRLLVNYFLKKFAKGQPGPPISIAPAALKALEKYHWPGNVRELENVIRRALVMAKGEAILPSDLPAEITGQGSPASLSLPTTAGEGVLGDVALVARQLFQWAKRDPKLRVIPAVERELVIQALKETDGNQVHAAKLLG